jgi:ATP-dependent Clp protease, protease subunit
VIDHDRIEPGTLPLPSPAPTGVAGYPPFPDRPQQPEPPERPGPGPRWPPELDPPTRRPPTAPSPLYPPIPVVYEDAPPLTMADRLLERRIVMVSGVLDAPTATEVAARIMLLDGTGDDPVQLLLSCSDGDLDAAMALADTVELAGVAITAVATGSLGGPAVLPYAVAPRRLAQPHSSFRLTEPHLDLTGSASDLVGQADAAAHRIATFVGRLATATGQPDALLADDLRRGRLLTAREAILYGLADQITERRPPR